MRTAKNLASTRRLLQNWKMQPPSLHSTFFFSLKQVQKRLKLEENSAPESSQQTPSLESLSTPIYVHVDQESNNNSISLRESSEPPSAFLTSSSNFTTTHQTPQVHSKDTTESKTEDVDDIEKLMQLLGIKGCGESEKGGEWCDQDSGFYERVVGVKGPKCGKEVERLEGWIGYFLSEREKGNESLSLAFLLLGKASCELDGGFGGLEFPSCVEEFLKLDPPTL